MSYQQIVTADGIPTPAQEEPKKKTIDLTVSVFFDGTNNNKDNVVAREHIKKKMYRDTNSLDTVNDSYSGTWSNVAELWDMYVADEKINPFIEKFYIEGAGTVEVKRETVRDKNGVEIEVTHYYNDEQSGYAFGEGATGVNAKVEKACKRIAEYVERMCKSKGVKGVGKLTIDVFGFSRGATAARSFVHRIYPPEGSMMPNGRILYNSPKIKTEGKSVFLPNAIIEKGFQVNKYEVRFLGLFDTVSSYSPGWNHYTDFENDVEELNLDIPKSKDRNKFEIKSVLHLVAADEYREYFSLITIDSAVMQGIGKQWILPGAHADIGGGYLETERENFIMDRHDFTSYSSYSAKNYRGYKSKKQLLEEGWATREQYDKINTVEKGEDFNNRKNAICENKIKQYPAQKKQLEAICWPLKYNPDPQAIYNWCRYELKNVDSQSPMGQVYMEILEELYPHRIVDYKYSYIPLHIMYDEAKGQGMQFNGDSQKPTWKEIPSALQPLYGRLKSINAMPFYKITSNEDTHKREIFFCGAPTEQKTMINAIHNQYIHLSSYNRQAYIGITLNPYSPEDEKKLRRIIRQG